MTSTGLLKRYLPKGAELVNITLDELGEISKVFPVLLLILSLSLAAVSIVAYYFDEGFKNQGLIFLTWLSSVLALILFAFSSTKPGGGKKLITARKKEIFLWLLLLLIAAGLRLCRLVEIPILGHDEARDAGLLPQAFLRGEIKDFFGYGVYGIPNLFVILASIPHLFFPETVLAVKLLAAFFGVLSVWLTFILARHWFGPTVGLTTGFLLSFYHVHLHFSRSELINLLDAFWAPLLVLTLIWALKKRGVWPLLLGLVAGLSLHFYQGMRALAAVSLIYFAIVTTWSLARLKLETASRGIVLVKIKMFLKNFILVLIGLVVGLGPSLVVILFRSQEFFNPGTAGRPVILGASFFELIEILPARISQTFGSLIFYPIRFHYDYGGPFLKLPLNLFFLTGLLVAARKIKKLEYHFLLIWAGLVIFLNSTILPEINYAHRLLSLVPALMIVTALGVDALGQPLKRLRFVLIGLVLLVAGFLNLKIYFVDEVWKQALLLNTNVATPAGYYVLEFPLSTKFYFLNSRRMSWKSVPSWEYLCQHYQISDVPPENFNNFILEFPLEYDDTVFIALPERGGDLIRLEKRLPGGKKRSFYFNSELVFFSYELAGPLPL